MDNDGYSEGTTITQCERPAGFRRISELSSASGDCNDSNGAVNPGAQELCGDNEDNNCDGQGDEVFDQDNDGYRTCDGDCNDLSASVNPGAAEICYDSIDNNCYEGADETCYECAMNKEIGSSANIGSGNLFHNQDTHIASLALIYNSKDSTKGPLGRGWTHTYNEYIKQPAAGSLLVTYGDGKKVYFFDDGSGIYHPAPGTGDHSSIVSDGSTYHLTRKDGTKYIFDETSGRLIEIRARNNNKTTLSYTGSNLTSVTDQAGRVTTFTYNAPGLIEVVTDHLGRSTLIYYDENGYLSRVTNPQGNAYQYSYDSEGRMLTKTDPIGNTTTYGYDIFNRVISSTTPSGTKTISYDQTTNTATITDQNGGLWQYTYNPILNVIVKTVDPAGNITTRAYDENRNLLSETDPVGNITTYTYDGSGNVLTMTNPAGQTSSYTYNPFGQVTSITGIDGNTTTYVYDPEGNLLSATDPGGAATRYSYDTRGNVTQITNAGGQTTSFTYDAYNNLTSITDSAGNTTTFVYDAVGNLLSVTDPSGAATVFECNNLNQLIRMSEPNGKITTFTYDANGNRTSQTDANGNTTFFEYDYRGQLIRVTDAIGGATAYTYGVSGCPSCGGGGEYLTSMTDANGNTTNYHYNTSGMLVSETDPLGNTASYTYDAVGNLISKTDGNGNTTTYTYDVLKRLIRKSYADGTQAAFTYDTKGNILTASNQHITYAFTYDANNRVTGVSDTIGHSIAYQYDALGNSTRMTSSDGRTITYSYDVANRLAQISSGAETFGFGYDASGRRMSLTYPNGVTASYSYDQGGRLTGLVHASASEQIDSITYTHDGIGNRLSRTTLDNKNLYTYDKLNRLTQSLPIKFQGKGKEHPKKASDFTYDPVGNRQTGPERNYYYSYNQDNQLTNDRKHQYVNDGNGNLISKTESDDDGNREIWAYAYDGENRLITAVKQEEDETKTVTFKYDPFGRRIEKAVTEGSTTTIKRYFYDNEDILFEYDDSGTIGNRYIHGPGIGEPLSVTTDSGTYYYHADGLGSITTLTDSEQKGVQKYEYDAFGKLHDEKNTVKQPYTFTGREWDKEVKLYYYRARYYDAKVGRFITPDPSLTLSNNPNIPFLLPHLLQSPQELNPYIYVQNNPVNVIDPYGLFGWDTVGGWIGKQIAKQIGKFAAKKIMPDKGLNMPYEGDDDNDGKPNFMDPDSEHCQVNCTKPAEPAECK